MMCFFVTATAVKKITGAAFATYGGVSAVTFNWLCHSSKLNKYQSSKAVTRYFCRHRGSTLISIDRAEPETIYLSLGLLDSNTPIIPQYHQFVSSKAHWYKITDRLPQYTGAYGC